LPVSEQDSLFGLHLRSPIDLNKSKTI